MAAAPIEVGDEVRMRIIEAIAISVVEPDGGAEIRRNTCLANANGYSAAKKNPAKARRGFS